MLRTDLPDHRRATETELVGALRERDPLALAEAYHRTIPAAHATARRLLSSSAEVEALLRVVYAQLWSEPPTDAPLEGWVRARCFQLAADDLRERNAAPAAPSLTVLLPDLPRSEHRYVDAAERALAALDDRERRALLSAHDQGVASGDQDDDGAAEALTGALLALAGPEPDGTTPDPAACADVPLLADWVLGLLPPSVADDVAGAAARPACTGLVKALRRGRRRLEGLPPTPDMGQRVLVVVLAGAPQPLASPSASAAGRAGGTPTPGVGAAGMPSALDDTGDLIHSAEAGPEQRVEQDAGTSPYTELSDLDADADHGDPVATEHGAVDTVGDGPAADADTDVDDAPPRRSISGRLVVWLLGVLFMLAGIAAGLYLGLTLLR